MSVLKTANKAEEGRVRGASTLDEMTRMGEPHLQRKGEERSRCLEAGGGRCGLERAEASVARAW